MFEKIVVALDGSSHSERALDTAIDMANRYDASLILFHAVQIQNIRGDFEAKVAQAAREAYRKVGQEIAEEIVGKAETRARTAGVKSLQRIIHEGEPAALIVGAAAAEQADLIVMGTRGISGLREIMVGSVAHKVTIAAHAPVLVTK
jgi:nucleotide-binding universal stress UspA family protein